MKSFFKINLISSLYAFLLFLIVELAGNIYRLSRITGWKLTTVDRAAGITSLLLFILFTVLCLFLTRKLLKDKKKRYFSVILWFPYFALFIYTFASLYPITNPGEDPSPALGLILIGAMVIYPIYIGFLNLLASL